MEDLNSISNQEEIKQKIKIIENIPTGVAPRAEAILVLLGEKPALEMFIPDKNKAPNAEEDLRRVGLSAEMRDEPTKRPRLPDSVNILVAGSQEILEELKQTRAFKDHKRYGELMGYPKTAIDAFVNEDKSRKLSSEEQREMELGLPDIFGGNFIFSKDHKDEELALVKRRLKLIAQNAPALFYELYSKEEADKFIGEALKY